MCVSMSSDLMIASLMRNINYTFLHTYLYTEFTTFACTLCIILEWYWNFLDWVIGKIGRSRGTSHSAFCCTYCTMSERTQDLIYFIPLCTSKVKMNNTCRHTYQLIISFQKYKKERAVQSTWRYEYCMYMHTW